MPGREAANDLDDDRGEQLLTVMEKASGVRQDACPWQAMRDPFVIAVLQAYRWRDRLPSHFGGDIPEAIRRGLDVYETALNATIAHDDRLERERREAEAAQRAEGGPARFAPARRRIPVRKRP